MNRGGYCRGVYLGGGYIRRECIGGSALLFFGLLSQLREKAKKEEGDSRKNLGARKKESMHRSKTRNS